ncbi:ABC transporter permease [Phocaeicola sp.]
MIGNYWNSAYRNLMKRKKFSFINVFGLAIGMASSLLILTYVVFEFSFDKMHEKYDRIYRVQSTFHEGEVLTDDWATSSFGYASAMQENLAGIEDYTRVGCIIQPEQLVKYGELCLREEGIAYADPGFFRLFDYELLEGDRATCLLMPGQVVITEHIARKYFRDEDPMGKILIFNSNVGTISCEVTGVMKEMPSNSHVHYNFLLSYKSLPQWIHDYWYKHEAYTYVLLDSPERKEEIEKAFPQMAEKYKTEEALKNKTWGVRLIPLKDIHLTPQLGYEAEQKGNHSALIALIFAAVAILIIAWINYINLTVVRSMERAKEVGVRRVVGAFPKQLVGQFLFEAMLMNVVAFVFAVGLIEVLLPAFNQLVGRTVTFSVWFTEYWGILVLVLFVGGIYISGYYPARALLHKKPIVLLKGKFQNSRTGERTRKILVIVQYTASMILLCGTLIVFAQLNYMRRQSLGVKTDQILVVKYPGSTEGMKTKMEAMRKAIKKLPLVSKVTCSGSVPGIEVAMFLSNRRTHDALKQNRLYEMLSCDPDFLDAYGLELVAGRGFSEEYGDDVNKLVINETAARTLGYVNNDDAIGEEISVETLNEPMQIIGVVKDYHQQALNKNYTPIMLFHKDKIEWIPQRYISIVMEPGDPSELVSQVSEVWTNYFADSSFDYFFLDQFYDRQYRQDEAFGVLMGGFTGLAIFISCLGLWVLVMFSCAVRTKEMGIRKVLGASHWDLFYQLGKEFFIPILIAILIALPVAWFSMNAWLSHYAFRTDLKAWFFLLPVVLMLLISFLTVAGQTMKVIYSKPARSLRYE